MHYDYVVLSENLNFGISILLCPQKFNVDKVVGPLGQANKANRFQYKMVIITFISVT